MDQIEKECFKICNNDPSTKKCAYNLTCKYVKEKYNEKTTTTPKSENSANNSSTKFEYLTNNTFTSLKATENLSPNITEEYDLEEYFELNEDFTNFTLPSDEDPPVTIFTDEKKLLATVTEILENYEKKKDNDNKIKEVIFSFFYFFIFYIYFRLT